MQNESFWTRLREILSNVELKTYLYALGAIAIIIAIIINVSGPSKYGRVKKDGKFYLNIEQIANDYGLNLKEENPNIDYANNTDKNLTQDLTNSLILTGLFLDQNGMTDKDAKGQIFANIVKEYQKQSKGKIYTKSDLAIIRGEDKNSLSEYYSDIDNAVAKYFSDIKNMNLNNNTDNLIKNTSLSEEKIVKVRSSISSDILKSIAVNDLFIEKLLSIPATNEGAIYQLQLINLISEENTYLKSLAYIDTDPAKYVMIDGDNFESKLSLNMTSILNAFGDYFRKNNAITD